MVKKHPKSSHKKPSQEELDKIATEAEALEKKKKKPDPPANPPEDPKPDPQPDPDPELDPDPKGDSDPKPIPNPDLKKKLSASARENQKINAKNKKINEAIDKGADLPQPTDEEMKQEYPDWDLMEDHMKKLAKDAIVSKRFRKSLVKAREEGRKIEKWNEQVDEFIADPETLTKNPDLENRLDEFKVYASDEVNSSIPFKVLIPAFLHNAKVPRKNKGQMFPKGSAGPSEKGKTKTKLTIEQGRRLRKTDQKKWKQMLMAGRIENDPSK